MTDVHGIVVETVTRNDDKAIVEFIARHDGLYEFRESHEQIDDETAWGAGILVYWGSGYLSGIYQTLSLAREDAHKLVDWFRTQS